MIATERHIGVQFGSSGGSFRDFPRVSFFANIAVPLEGFESLNNRFFVISSIGDHSKEIETVLTLERLVHLGELPFATEKVSLCRIVALKFGKSLGVDPQLSFKGRLRTSGQQVFAIRSEVKSPKLDIDYTVVIRRGFRGIVNIS